MITFIGQVLRQTLVVSTGRPEGPQLQDSAHPTVVAAGLQLCPVSSYVTRGNNA